MIAEGREADHDLISIWRQATIPVIVRRGGSQPLLVKLPFLRENPHHWLRGGARYRNPAWNFQYRCWEVPRGSLERIGRMILVRFARMYLIQPFRPMEKCAPACMEAMGLVCECSCMGANHGAGTDNNWHVVSETFAYRWHDREYGCRLIERGDY